MVCSNYLWSKENDQYTLIQQSNNLLKQSAVLIVTYWLIEFGYFTAIMHSLYVIVEIFVFWMNFVSMCYIGISLIP